MVIFVGSVLTYAPGLEKIGISVAYELSMLPEEVQEHAAAALWSKGTPVTLEDVRKWKPAEREQPKTERTEPKPAEDGPEYKPGVYVREVETKMHVEPPELEPFRRSMGRRL